MSGNHHKRRFVEILFGLMLISVCLASDAMCGSWTDHFWKGLKAGEKGEWEKAVAELERSQSIVEQSGIQVGNSVGLRHMSKYENEMYLSIPGWLCAGYSNLASAKISSGEVILGDSLAKIAVAHCEVSKTKPSWMTGIAMTNLGRAKLHSGNPEEAERWLRMGLAGIEASQLQESWAPVWASSVLGECYWQLGKFYEAESLLSNALVGLRLVRDSAKPSDQVDKSAMSITEAEILGTLGSVYVSIGDTSYGDSLVLLSMDLLESAESLESWSGSEVHMSALLERRAAAHDSPEYEIRKKRLESIRERYVADREKR